MADMRTIVKALLAKTVEKGCTEEEALAAAAKARELIEKHQIDMGAEAIIASGVELVKGIGGDSFCLAFQRIIAHDLGLFAEVRSFYQKRLKTFTLCGFKSDVEFAKDLMETLTDFAKRGATGWVRAEMERNYSHLPVEGSSRRNQAWKLRLSFAQGCAYRIAKRLEKLTDERKAAVYAGSRALVPVDKKVAIDDFMGNLNIKTGRAQVVHANTAFWAGHSHGDKAVFNKTLQGA